MTVSLLVLLAGGFTINGTTPPCVCYPSTSYLIAPLNLSAPHLVLRCHVPSLSIKRQGLKGDQQSTCQRLLFDFEPTGTKASYLSFLK